MARNSGLSIEQKIAKRKQWREKRGMNTQIEPNSRGTFPKMIERRYERELAKTIDVAKELIDEAVVPRLGEFVDEVKALDVRKDSYVEDFVAILGAIKLRFARRVTETQIERQAQDTAQTVDNQNKQIFDRQINQVVGVTPFASSQWLPSTLSNFVQQNVTLIKTAHEDYFKDIETFTLRGLEQGDSAQKIAKKIQERTGVSKNRAKLIARDQVGKLNSNLATKRAADIGVKKFRWSTSGDERVRSSHAALNNQIFTYGEGASVDGESNVLPGQPIQCRCIAVPLLSSIDE